MILFLNNSKDLSKIHGGKYLESSKGTPTFLNAAGYYSTAPLTLLYGQMQEKILIIPLKNFIKARKCVSQARLNCINKP